MAGRPPTPGTPSDLAAVRAAIAVAGRRLGARGLISAGEGNISIRIDDARLATTPTGRRKDELAADDVLVVPLAADAAPSSDGPGPRPSTDIRIHRAIYVARPDVRAVVHAHLPAAMALTLAGEVPDPSALPETALLLPRLPFVPYGTPGSEDLATRVAVALATQDDPLPGAVLLERHGGVAVGATVDEAVNRLELVEVLCRTWRDALLIRHAVARDGPRAILPAPGSGPGAPARGRGRRSRQ